MRCSRWSSPTSSTRWRAAATIVSAIAASSRRSLELEQGDLVETRADSALLSLTRGQETELPASAKVRFISSSGDYSQAVAEARRITGASGRVSQADLPLVLEGAQAEAIAETWLFEAWAARERASFALPPSLLAVEPADIVRIDDDGGGRLFRVTEIGEHGARDIEARGVDPEIYGGSRAARSARRAPVRLSSPASRSSSSSICRCCAATSRPAAGYVAATQAPWPGSVAVYGSPETTGYALKALATAPATMGVTLDDLPARRPRPASITRTRLTVKVEGEELSLVHAAATARRAQRGGAAQRRRRVGGHAVPDGDAHCAGHLRAVRTAARAGRQRVRHAAAAWRRARASCSSIRAVARVDLAASEIRLPYSWRYGPATRDIGDASYAAAAHTFQGLRAQAAVAGARAREPRRRRRDDRLDPAHAHRRRQLGDAGGAAGEDVESYEVDILDGASVVRTLTATAPSVVYTRGGAGGRLRLRAARLRHPRLPDVGLLRPRHPPRRDGVSRPSSFSLPPCLGERLARGE